MTGTALNHGPTKMILPRFGGAFFSQPSSAASSEKFAAPRVRDIAILHMPCPIGNNSSGKRSPTTVTVFTLIIGSHEDAVRMPPRAHALRRECG